MPTQPKDMTDLQLDITLEHCYREHRDATLGRRAVIHQVIVDVLAEQKRRRDEWLRSWSPPVPPGTPPDTPGIAPRLSPSLAP